MDNIFIEKNIVVAMCDGVKLATDIYPLDGAAQASLMDVHSS